MKQPRGVRRADGDFLCDLVCFVEERLPENSS